jgi:two-component system chemotaxis response regulator CheY
MALNILVVDDSAVMRSMVIKTIQRAELELGDVYEAANGQEALDILGKSWIDLAVVDINMPVMDGEELIERVRAEESTRKLPVLVVSSESSKMRVELLQKKDAGFIHKPFTPESLRDAILKVFG